MIEQREEATAGAVFQTPGLALSSQTLIPSSSRSFGGGESAFQPSSPRGGAALIFLPRVPRRVLTVAASNERGSRCASEGETEACCQAQGPILGLASQGPSLLQLIRVAPATPLE